MDDRRTSVRVLTFRRNLCRSHISSSRATTSLKGKSFVGIVSEQQGLSRAKLLGMRELLHEQTTNLQAKLSSLLHYCPSIITVSKTKSFSHVVSTWTTNLGTQSITLDIHFHNDLQKERGLHANDITRPDRLHYPS